MGEALYLGKPVFAMPEDGNQEQEINGYFLGQSGAGLSTAMANVTPALLKDFLDRSEDFTAAIDRQRLCGNHVAFELIDRYCHAPQGHTVGSRSGSGTNQKNFPLPRKEAAI